MDEEKRVIRLPLPAESDTELSAVSMEEARAKMICNLDQIVGGIAQSFSVAHELANTIRPALASFAKMAQELAVTMKPIVEAVQQAAASFAKVIADFQIPSISEERKQELIASYKKWGEYGWTLLPHAPFDCFDEPPASIEAANATMKTLCSKRSMELLFAELRGHYVKKKDLDAAILCYDNRQYKACALILFGLIDAKLIRKQKHGIANRKTGSKAAKKLREQFENGDNEIKFFTMLHCMNLFACLETLFANANDFKAEPSTINRNFVSHGMTRRPVRQRDCIQLFLALYNLMLFFEFTA